MSSPATAVTPTLEELKKATTRLNKAGALANSIGLFSRDDARRMRWALKRGAPSRRPRYGPALRGLIRSYHALAREFEARVKPPEGTTEPTEPPATDERPRATRPDSAELASDALDSRAGWREEELEQFLEKWEVVRLMESGYSASKAIKALGLPRTTRWARKVFARYKELGRAGLIDQRKFNGRSRSVLTFEACRRALGLAFARPAAGDTAVARTIVSDLRAEGVAPPSESTLVAYLKRLPPEVRALLRGDANGHRQNCRPVMRVERAARPNERFQVDHSVMKTWGKIFDPTEGQYKPARVYLTLAIDVYSRAVVGWLISAGHPDSWAIALMIRHAVLPKRGDRTRPYGVPDILQTDRGRDFKSKHVTAACAGLGIRVQWDPPRNPDSKGVVERLFRTIDQQCMRLLPGHKAAIGTSEHAAKNHVADLLTIPDISTAFGQWVEEYHGRVHTSTQQTPLERWRTIEVVKEVHEDELDLLLLKASNATRVRNTGIAFMRGKGGGYYLSQNPMVRTGRRVVIRYNPDKLDVIRVFDADTGDDLGEAFRVGSKPGQLQQLRTDRRWHKKATQMAFRRYAEGVRAGDRPKASERAAAAAAQAQGATELEVKDPEVRSEVDAWVDVLRQLEQPGSADPDGE